MGVPPKPCPKSHLVEGEAEVDGGTEVRSSGIVWSVIVGLRALPQPFLLG